ncbi:hypothetical protein WA158_000403 [Blastocystis sp. Blastoise]
MNSIKYDTFASEVEKLRSCIDQNSQLSGHMCEGLDDMNQKLSSIEKYMTKFNSDILPLKIARGNLSDYMDELSQIQYHFDTVARTAASLEVGSLPAHPKEYTDAMIDVHNSILYLEPHPEWKSQPHTISLLIDINIRSLKECTEEFNRYLSGDNIITNETNPPSANTSVALNGIPNDKIEYIKTIIDTMITCQETSLETYYIQARSKYFINVIDYYVNAKIQDKKEDTMLQSVAYCFAHLYEYVTSEWQLLSLLFSDEKANELIGQVLAEPIHYIEKQLSSSYMSLQKQSSVTYEDINNMIIYICDGLFSLSNALPLYTKFLTSVNSESLLDMINNILKDLHVYVYTLLVKSVTQLQLYGEKNSISICDDGSVNKVTTTAISLLSELMPYIKILPDILLPYEQVDIPDKKFYVFDDAVQLYFTIYLARLQELLKCSAKNNTNVVLCHFYLANNYDYVCEHFTSIASCVSQNMLDMYKDLFNDEFKNYEILTWSKIKDILSSEPDLVYISNDKLDEDSKVAIKDVFRSFIHKFDQLIDEESKWTIVSQSLKQRYMDIILPIVPLYQYVYEKYANTHFTKKGVKIYLKYKPDNVENRIKTLFFSSN